MSVPTSRTFRRSSCDGCDCVPEVSEFGARIRAGPLCFVRTGDVGRGILRGTTIFWLSSPLSNTVSLPDGKDECTSGVCFITDSLTRCAGVGNDGKLDKGYPSISEINGRSSGGLCSFLLGVGSHADIGVPERDLGGLTLLVSISEPGFGVVIFVSPSTILPVQCP